MKNKASKYGAQGQNRTADTGILSRILLIISNKLQLLTSVKNNLINHLAVEGVCAEWRLLTLKCDIKVGALRYISVYLAELALQASGFLIVLFFLF